MIQRLRVGVMGTDDFAYDKLASISMYLDRRLDSILEHASGNNAPTADN
jgi:hypothetical protein